MMSLEGTSHSNDFQPNKPFVKDNLSHAKKISAKISILPSVEKMPLSNIETTLNRQFENAMYLKRMLSNINQEVKNIAHSYTKMARKVEGMNKRVKQASTQHNRLIRQFELRLYSM